MDFPKRKQLRLPDYDYSSPGAYFVTICTHERRCILSDITVGAAISRPQTTPRDIPANFLRHYPQYKKGVFNLTELARLCDISRTTAYKYIGLLEG